MQSVNKINSSYETLTSCPYCHSNNIKTILETKDYFSKKDRNGYEDWWHNDELIFQEGYTTEVITNNALNFIQDNRDEPFFLYIAHLAVHFPWQAPEDKHLETRRQGEDFTRIYPGPQSKLGPHKPEEVPTVFRSMIEKLDSEVGRVIDFLRKEGLDENTLVFFTSDNGGYLYYADDVWPEVGSNGMLKGQKGQVYEGGHRVPAIAWWPGKIEALSVCDEPAMSFDLLPTFLELLRIPVPGKESPNAIDGVSLLPLLFENKPIESRPLFWRMNNQRAVRHENWKLVFRNEENNPELYHLKTDVGENHNLASEYPEKVSLLKSKLDQWEKEVTGK